MLCQKLNNNFLRINFIKKNFVVIMEWVVYLFYERTRNEYHHLQCWRPKKSRVSGIFFQQINTENQQQINCWCPKIVPKFSHPYGGQSEILPKFRNVLRKFQQQINRAITELDFFWDINTANGDICFISVVIYM